ncbi:uncharacterized protein LOC126749732 isoform X2 [Anthonomus grandis grandis]|uniref:uncharacterized protein LOC126749732 isoform X2 n=1 Tax=Anthonomus grandis grandis TaxID=2921223 RepID=UPI002164F386|nr:uncharacterized protein LOC126749732 isoform X2 [Anthonomus grandis grandis]
MKNFERPPEHLSYIHYTPLYVDDYSDTLHTNQSDHSFERHVLDDMCNKLISERTHEFNEQDQEMLAEDPTSDDDDLSELKGQKINQETTLCLKDSVSPGDQKTSDNVSSGIFGNYGNGSSNIDDLDPFDEEVVTESKEEGVNKRPAVINQLKEPDDTHIALQGVSELFIEDCTENQTILSENASETEDMKQLTDDYNPATYIVEKTARTADKREANVHGEQVFQVQNAAEPGDHLIPTCEEPCIERHPGTLTKEPKKVNNDEDQIYSEPQLEGSNLEPVEQDHPLTDFNERETQYSEPELEVLNLKSISQDCPSTDFNEPVVKASAHIIPACEEPLVESEPIDEDLGVTHYSEQESHLEPVCQGYLSTDFKEPGHIILVCEEPSIEGHPGTLTKESKEVNNDEDQIYSEPQLEGSNLESVEQYNPLTDFNERETQYSEPELEVPNLKSISQDCPSTDVNEPVAKASAHIIPACEEPLVESEPIGEDLSVTYYSKQESHLEPVCQDYLSTDYKEPGDIISVCEEPSIERHPGTLTREPKEVNNDEDQIYSEPELEGSNLEPVQQYNSLKDFSERETQYSAPELEVPNLKSMSQDCPSTDFNKPVVKASAHIIPACEEPLVESEPIDEDHYSEQESHLLPVCQDYLSTGFKEPGHIISVCEEPPIERHPETLTKQPKEVNNDEDQIYSEPQLEESNLEPVEQDHPLTDFNETETQYSEPELEVLNLKSISQDCPSTDFNEPVAKASAHIIPACEEPLVESEPIDEDLGVTHYSEQESHLVPVCQDYLSTGFKEPGHIIPVCEEPSIEGHPGALTKEPKEVNNDEDQIYSELEWEGSNLESVEQYNPLTDFNERETQYSEPELEVPNLKSISQDCPSTDFNEPVAKACAHIIPACKEPLVESEPIGEDLSVTHYSKQESHLEPVCQDYLSTGFKEPGHIISVCEEPSIEGHPGTLTKEPKEVNNDEDQIYSEPQFEESNLEPVEQDNPLTNFNERKTLYSEPELEDPNLEYAPQDYSSTNFNAHINSMNPSETLAVLDNDDEVKINSEPELEDSASTEFISLYEKEASADFVSHYDKTESIKQAETFSADFQKMVNGYEAAVDVIKEVQGLLKRHDNRRSLDEGIEDLSFVLPNSEETSDKRFMKMGELMADYLVEQGFEMRELVLFPETDDHQCKKFLGKLLELFKELYPESLCSVGLNDLRIAITGYVIDLLKADQRFADDSSDSDSFMSISDKIFTISEYVSDLLDSFFASIEKSEFESFMQDVSHNSAAQSTPEKHSNAGESPGWDTSVTSFKKDSKLSSESLWIAISPAARAQMPVKKTPINVDEIPLRPPADLVNLWEKQGESAAAKDFRSKPRHAALSPISEEAKVNLLEDEIKSPPKNDLKSHSGPLKSSSEVNLVICNEVNFYRSRSKLVPRNIVFTTDIVFSSEGTNDLNDENKENHSPLDDSGDWMGFDGAKF